MSLNNWVEEVKNKAVSALTRNAEDAIHKLADATPKDTGKTSESWGYKLAQNKNHYEVVFTNSNKNKNYNVAILIQNGHATKDGKFVEGIDYINPVIKEVFDNIKHEIN